MSDRIRKLPADMVAWRDSVLLQYRRRCAGILHLGAHLGEEAERYAGEDKPVVWVEALPQIHQRLVARIEQHRGQQALCALLGDCDDTMQPFHISNNFDGASSSIFGFGNYGQGSESLWPHLNLSMTDTIELPMRRLDSLLRANQLDPAAFDFWVVDLQGAELVALKGSVESLASCRALLVETSTMPVYDGGVLWDELQDWLAAQGFVAMWQPAMPHDDVLFVARRELEEVQETFGSQHYRRHDHARLEHLAALELPLQGRCVLEVGAGLGEHTEFFLARNCGITTTDVRPENLYLLRQRFAENTAVQVAMLDMDTPPESGGCYDIVHCYGLLYHLRNPGGALEFLASCCGGMLLLETCVSDGSKDPINCVNEPAGRFDQSFHGNGCRPNRAWIWNNLKRLFPYVYLTSTQPAHEEFPLGWSAPRGPVDALRRAVFVASRFDLGHNPNLSASFIDRHVGRTPSPNARPRAMTRGNS